MQDYIIIGDDFVDDSHLEHYGVLGMKWHHHRASLAKGNADIYYRRAKAMRKQKNDAAAETFERKAKSLYAKSDKHMQKNYNNMKKKPGVYGSKYNDITKQDISKARKNELKMQAAVTAAGPLALTAYSLYTNHQMNKAYNRMQKSQEEFERNRKRWGI